MFVRTGSGFKEETDVDTNIAHPDTPSGTSRSHFGEPAINTADAGTSLLSYVGIAKSGEDLGGHAQEDDWLTRHAGRCSFCGYHTATQGHHPICSGRTRRAQH